MGINYFRKHLQSYYSWSAYQSRNPFTPKNAIDFDLIGVGLYLVSGIFFLNNSKNVEKRSQGNLGVTETVSRQDCRMSKYLCKPKLVGQQS